MSEYDKTIVYQGRPAWLYYGWLYLIGLALFFVERLLGIGTIITISAAEGESAVAFKGIRDPHGVKERIREIYE